MTRAEPKQQRSTDTRSRLTVAAYQVIEEVGRDRFTTAMIAKKAGSSIGTVYRYFDSRIDVLDALYPDRFEGLGKLAPVADVVIYDGPDQ